MFIGIGCVVKHFGYDGEKFVGVISNRYNPVSLQLWVGGNIGTLVNMPVISCAIHCQQASKDNGCPCESETWPDIEN